MAIKTLEATSVFYNLLLLKLIFSHLKKYSLVAEIIGYNSI
ncbi:Uncharacterized protein APZ42_007910 [Daphnia magna]|uniref:Uncharacterized protein n=1 Tax=Daphnia magna TaxID=35525 RepID=A0A164F084_9CRUS|nr:Uncharacterized protein APZ42_007910 [Daphnia magna]